MQNKQNAILEPAAAKVDLEDQFILRLPVAESKIVHDLLRSKPKRLKKSLQIRIEDDMKHGMVYVKKKPLNATLVHLPTIVESCKSINKINVYKTGTVSQMLVCDERTEQTANEDPKRYLYPHGICPPMKNVRKQRFRKTMKNQVDVKEAADVQKEVMLLLRTDYEAVASRFELISSSGIMAPPVEEITEHMLFGAMSSSDSEEGSSTMYDIMEFTN